MVILHLKGPRGVPEYVHLGGFVGLHPDHRGGFADVAQHRTEQESHPNQTTCAVRAVWSTGEPQRCFEFGQRLLGQRDEGVDIGQDGAARDVPEADPVGV